MGGQFSKIELSTKDITEMISKAIINVTNDCSTSTLQTQNIDLNHVKNVEISGFNFDQKSSLNINCVQKIKNNVDTTNKISEDITTQLKNKLSGQNIGIQAADSKNLTDIITKISNSIDYESVTKCIGSYIQVQQIKVKDAEDVKIINSQMSQVMNVIKNCLQEDQNVISSVNELKQKVSALSENSVEGALNTATIISLAIAAIVVIIGILLLRFFKGSPPNSNVNYTPSAQDAQNQLLAQAVINSFKRN